MSIGDRPNLYFYQNILAKKIVKKFLNIINIATREMMRMMKHMQNDLLRSLKKIISIGPDRVCAFVAETIAGGLVGDVPPNKKIIGKNKKSLR